MTGVVERAVVVLPLHDARIERFRRDLDPLADAVPAHVTLVYPTPVDLPTARAAMFSAAGRQSSFEYAFSEPAVVQDEYLFLLAHRGAEEFRGLHEELYRQLGRPLPDVFQPHVTIARTAAVARLDAARSTALAEGLHIAGTATALCLYRLDGPGRLVREQVVAFAAPDGRRPGIPRPAPHSPTPGEDVRRSDPR